MAILGSSDNQTQQLRDIISSLESVNVSINNVYKIQSQLLSAVQGSSSSDQKAFASIKDTMDRQTASINRYFSQNYGGRNTTDVASAQVSSTTRLISSQNGTNNEAINAEVVEVAKTIRESTQKLVEASKNANASNETILKLIGVMEKQTTNMEAIGKIVKDIKDGKISSAEDFYKKSGMKISDADKLSTSKDVDNLIVDIRSAFKDYDKEKNDDDTKQLREESSKAIIQIRDAIVGKEKDENKEKRTYKKEKKNIGGLGGVDGGLSMSTFGLPTLASLSRMAIIAGGIATIIGILEAWKSDKEWKTRLEVQDYVSDYRRKNPYASNEDVAHHIKEKFGGNKGQYEAAMRWLRNAEYGWNAINQNFALEPKRKEGPKSGRPRRASELGTQHANQVQSTMTEFFDSHYTIGNLGWMLGPAVTGVGIGFKVGGPYGAAVGGLIGSISSAYYGSYKVSEAYWKGVDRQNTQEHQNYTAKEQELTRLANVYREQSKKIQPAILKFKNETIVYMLIECKNLITKLAVFAQRESQTRLFGYVIYESPTKYSDELIVIYEAIIKIFEQYLDKIDKDETFDDVIKHRQEFINELEKMMSDKRGLIRRFWDLWVHPGADYHESAELRDEIYKTFVKVKMASSQSINSGYQYKDVPAFGKGSKLPDIRKYDLLPNVDDDFKFEPINFKGTLSRLTGTGDIEIFKEGKWKTIPRNVVHDIEMFNRRISAGEEGAKLMQGDESIYEISDGGKNVKLLGGSENKTMEDAYYELFKTFEKIYGLKNGNIVNIFSGGNARSLNGNFMPFGKGT